MKRKISSTRSQRGFAPVLRPKVKKRPRGKPFPKGNQYGVASRFIKGQSGNPGGKPRTKEVSHASREWLAQPTTLPELLANKLPRELEGWTHAAVLAWIRGQMRWNSLTAQKASHTRASPSAATLILSPNWSKRFTQSRSKSVRQ